MMRETTHREFLAWIDWLNEEKNNPSRSDNYLMQIAAEIRSVLHKNPRSIKLEHFRIKFGKIEKTAVTKEQATRNSKRRWFGLVQGN